MKVDTTDKNEIRVKGFFNGLVLETTEGNTMKVFPRDDTFEFFVKSKGSDHNAWFRVDMRTLKIYQMQEQKKAKDIDEDGNCDGGG